MTYQSFFFRIFAVSNYLRLLVDSDFFNHFSIVELLDNMSNVDLRRLFGDFLRQVFDEIVSVALFTVQVILVASSMRLQIRLDNRLVLQVRV